MKVTRLATAGVLVLAWASVSSGVDAMSQPGAQAAGAIPATKEADRLALFIRGIEREDNPTVITAAYARGMEMFPGNARLHGAYVRRMVKLGHLALAYQPAGLLAKLDPGHALAWAVVAHMHAGREEYQQALAAALTAARHGLDEPFVLNVAGQMVAWYDHEAEKEKTPEAVRRSLADMREDLDKREGFTSAYKAAKTFLEEAAREKLQAEEEVFIPDHLKKADDAVSDRERRVRELIDELDRRRETARTCSHLCTSSVHVGHYYVPYYPYYAYGGFGFGCFGHWRIIFGHGLFPGRHRCCGHHHGHPGGSTLVVTVHNQKHLFGRLVITPHHSGLIFGHRGSRLGFRGRVGTLGGRGLRAPTQPLETIRRRAGPIPSPGTSRRGVRAAGRALSINSRTIRPGSRTISPGSRTIGPRSRTIGPRSRTIGPRSRTIGARSRTAAFRGRSPSIDRGNAPPRRN